MSVYRITKKDPKSGKRVYSSKVYQADFVVTTPDGQRHRIRRSTGQKEKRAAKRVVAHWKELAACGELGFINEWSVDGMTLAEACWKYWDEVGQHQRSASDVAKNLEHICRLIGGHRKFVEISPADLADAARRRAGEPRRGGTIKDETKRDQLVSLSTVNRQVVIPFRSLWRRAARVWHPAGLGPEPIWSDLLYEESEGRTRTLSEEEAAIFWQNLREDYRPCLEFGVNRGLRVKEMIIKRADVDLDRGECMIRIAKKRGGVRSERMKLSPRETSLIKAEMKKAPGDYVWTYEVQRGKMKGMRQPITLGGLRTFFRRYIEKLRKEFPGKFQDFRPHDLRHDFATVLLRNTGNLELVRKALRHADIQSTRRYAHVTGDEVSAAIEARPTPAYSPQTFPKRNA